MTAVLQRADWVVVAAALAVGAGLLSPRLRRSGAWRATLTPLASIIGSGFLVLAPLLVHEFGRHAVTVMAGLCALAYLIGAVIRGNMAAVARRPLADSGWAARLEGASSWALSLAYVVSVCYYLNLFGAFAVRLTPWHAGWQARVVTSAALVLVAVLGWTGGLRALERAEALAVGIKLTVIGGLLAGMLLYVSPWGALGAWPQTGGQIGWHALPLMFGLLITVQGFETSRYLGEAYDTATRIRTMRRAQWIATAIYVAYVGLASLAFGGRTVALDETAVIGLTTPVAAVLPPLLVLAALAAQFSAAVADTNGCGGLVSEMSRARVPPRLVYALLVATALTLTWAADIFAIISLASRAFALYYAL